MNLVVPYAYQCYIESPAIFLFLFFALSLLLGEVHASVHLYRQAIFRKKEVDNPPSTNDVLNSEPALQHAVV